MATSTVSGSPPVAIPHRPSGREAKHDAIGLLDADPDLGAGLAPERRAAAGALVVGVHRLGVGAWQVERMGGAGGGHIGLLVLDGVISRQLTVAEHLSIELLGPGDLIRPWRPPGPTNLLTADVEWSVLSPMTLALLDRRLAGQLTAWPEIVTCLCDRLAERSERLATMQAISQLTGVDRRVSTLFWHLAERWGRVGSDGVVIPLALTHRLLGQLVGARRPTVSGALSELAERGELVRRPDGSWLLRGEPPPTGAAARVIVPHGVAGDLLRPPR